MCYYRREGLEGKHEFENGSPWIGDPHNPLTLRDDKDKDKYTHTQIHKLEVFERPIMCYISKKHGGQGYQI